MTKNLGTRKIAYYSINDPLDKRSWSGITYYMGKTLEKHIGPVHFLGPVNIPRGLDKTFRAIQKFSRFFFRTEWIPKYSLIKNIYAAWKLKSKLAGQYYDLIIAPAAAPELAYLKTKLPIVYFGDATFKIYSETYKKEFKNLNSFSNWEGHHLEKKALKKSSLIIFSSKWAARSAIKDYCVSPQKIEVIQMGANIDYVPDKKNIYLKENNVVLTLLFLSVDWDRKGGPIAYETLLALHNAGKSVKLIVCGCLPPAEYTHQCIEVIPFLNKNEKQDFERFVKVMSSVHFLLLPTRADCTPLVNCEANAYGVPAITTNVGGISEAVINGVNGYCLPIEADGNAYAKLIDELFSDKERYLQLVKTSRERFDQVLNWDRFADDLSNVLTKHNL